MFEKTCSVATFSNKQRLAALDSEQLLLLIYQTGNVGIHWSCRCKTISERGKRRDSSNCICHSHQNLTTINWVNCELSWARKSNRLNQRKRERQCTRPVVGRIKLWQIRAVSCQNDILLYRRDLFHSLLFQWLLYETTIARIMREANADV